MWNFSNRGLIIIYPQDLLGYKNVAVLFIFLDQLNAIWFSTAFEIRSKTSLCPKTDHHTIAIKLKNNIELSLDSQFLLK